MVADTKNKILIKTFSANVIPSVLGFALSAIYTIVDGFFIGHSMGDVGLAAITVGFPVAAFIQAIGTGVGIAGGIQYSISKAKEEKQKALEYYSLTTFLMTGVSILFTILFYVFAEPILLVLGASGEILAMATEYVEVIALGTIFQLLATGLIPFVRNMNGASYAMFTMILGFSMNIVLDYVLVWMFPFGMFGAALATVIGQASSLIAVLLFLIRKKYKLVKICELSVLESAKKIFGNALSPFGLSFSSQLTLLFMNKYLFLYGSGQDVAVFGCIDYILSIVYYLIQGVGDGSQPLISFYYGRKEKKTEKYISKLAYISAFIITVFFILIVFINRKQIGYLFGASSETNTDVIYYLPWFLMTLLFLCYSRITTTYFYATEKTKWSYILVYGEPLCTFFLLFILSGFIGLRGVWLSIPTSQVILFLVAFTMKRKM